MDWEGIGEGASWPPERSLLILNISRGKAISLGQRFGQLAIVVGRRGEASRLGLDLEVAPAPPYYDA